MGDHSHSLDLLTLVALLGIGAQVGLFALILLRVGWAIKLPGAIPAVVRNIGAVFVGILCLNSASVWLKLGEQQFQTTAYFTMLLLTFYNTVYAEATRKNIKYELDMQILLKQSKQQQEAYMTLLSQQDQLKKESAKQKEAQDTKELGEKTSVLEKRLLEEQIKSLKEAVDQLTFENEEMRKKGISAKKEK